MGQEPRWSDEKLEMFYEQFQQHIATEAIEKSQQKELYDAIFQKEDRDANTPPGLLQMCGRMSKDLSDMKITTDRQKRFVGGIAFAFSSMLFFFTDTAHKLFSFLKGV